MFFNISLAIYFFVYFLSTTEMANRVRIVWKISLWVITWMFFFSTFALCYTLCACVLPEPNRSTSLMIENDLYWLFRIKVKKRDMLRKYDHQKTFVQFYGHWIAISVCLYTVKLYWYDDDEWNEEKRIHAWLHIHER